MVPGPARHEVGVGISIDGPREIHDASRVDHSGEGSYERVSRGFDALRSAGISAGVLAVVRPGDDGLGIHRHFLEMGASSISYLLPDFTHDTVGPIRDRHGPTPCADYLIPILEEWWSSGYLDVRVGIFWHMSRVILGGESRIDILGNRPLRFAFVEADGSIEGLDVLRICRNGAAGTSLNVLDNDFIEIAEVSELGRSAIFEGVPLPAGCRACPERTTCGGGYLPHRHSRARGFDNPTVWCADMLRLFGRLRELLEVPVEETSRRRGALARVLVMN